jgi:hypothetical protein
LTVGRVAGHEEAVRLDPAVVDPEQDLGILGIVHRVIQPGHRARRVAKRRMGGDVGDALAVDPHLAPVAQALQVLIAGVDGALPGRARGHEETSRFVRTRIISAPDATPRPPCRQTFVLAAAADADGRSLP